MSSNVSKRQQNRSYVFTINNWNETDASQIQSLCDSGKLKYLVAGKEVGESGTPHIQGYCVFKNPCAFSTVKGALSRAHIAVALGNAEENFAYCSKEGDYIEFGSRPMSSADKGLKGKEYWETQWKLAVDDKLDEIDPKLKLTHWKTLVSIRDYHLKDLGNQYRPGVKNYWLYGPTGTGKSRAVREAFSDIYYKMANKWWNNYTGQDVVLIEDLDKSHAVLGHHLKLWADSYPFRGEVKNSTMMARPKHIVVTSNYHPKDVFLDDGILLPLLRRFTLVLFPLPLNMTFQHVSAVLVSTPTSPPTSISPQACYSPPASLPVDELDSELFVSNVCRYCAMECNDPVDHLRTCPKSKSDTMPEKDRKRSRKIME